MTGIIKLDITEENSIKKEKKKTNLTAHSKNNLVFVSSNIIGFYVALNSALQVN